MGDNNFGEKVIMGHGPQNCKCFADKLTIVFSAKCFVLHTQTYTRPKE